MIIAKTCGWILYHLTHHPKVMKVIATVCGWIFGVVLTIALPCIGCVGLGVVARYAFALMHYGWNHSAL